LRRTAHIEGRERRAESRESRIGNRGSGIGVREPRIARKIRVIERSEIARGGIRSRRELKGAKPPAGPLLLRNYCRQFLEQRVLFCADCRVRKHVAQILHRHDFYLFRKVVFHKHVAHVRRRNQHFFQPR